MIQKKHVKRFTLLVSIAVLASTVLLGLFLAIIVLHRTETKSDVAQLSQRVPLAAGYLDIDVRVTSVDLNQEKMEIQLGCMPKGSLVNGEGELKQGLTITYLSLGLKQTATLDRGETGDYLNADVDLKGNVADYPWDKHTAQIALSVTGRGTAGQPEVVIPTRLQSYGAWPGLDLNFGAHKEESFALQVMDIAVIRSTTTTIVVCFSIVLTWVLIAAVISMIAAVALGGHDLHIGMFAFFGTLLFALTAFRNAMPGTPPMGVLSDYMAFFWGYAVAIIAIGVLSVTWLRRLPPKGTRPSK